MANVPSDASPTTGLRLIAPFSGVGGGNVQVYLSSCGQDHVRVAPQVEMRTGRAVEVAGVSQGGCGKPGLFDTVSAMDLSLGLSTNNRTLSQAATQVIVTWNLSYDFHLCATGNSHDWTYARIEVGTISWILVNGTTTHWVPGLWSGPYETVSSRGTHVCFNGSANGLLAISTISMKIPAGANVSVNTGLLVSLEVGATGPGPGYCFAHWNLGYGGRHGRLASIQFR